MTFLRALFADLKKLFEHKLALYLLMAALLQIAYWYLGSPGPQLLRGTPRTLGAALFNISSALLFLLVLPTGLMVGLGDSLRRVGLGLGNWRFGVSVTLIASLIAIVAMYLGSSDPSLQLTYPWAGEWVGASPFNLSLWIFLYGLYYVSFEFFYRGFMLRVIEPLWGLSAAIWTQALASTLIHLGKPPAETFAALPAGLLFAVLAVRGRSLLYPIVLHLIIGISTDIFVLQRQGLLFP